MDISKTQARTVLAGFWSVFGAIYIIGITFADIPIANQRVVDTVLGFVLGTIVATIIAFYFGSSQGSVDKDKMKITNETN